MTDTASDARCLRTCAVTLLAVLAVLAGGCTTNAPPPLAGKVRTDPATITREFPQLGRVVEAHWRAGPLGVADDRAPGPTDQLVEAALRLTPADLARLAGHYHFAPAGPPQPPAELAPFLAGNGVWSASDGLDRDTGAPRWFGTVRIRLDTGVAYLRATTH